MLVYLSHVLDENTPTYGDRDQFKIEPKSIIKDGVGANTSTWIFSNNHMGTHMDAPYHFCEAGRKTANYTAEELYFKNVVMVDVPCASARLIDRNDLDFEALSKEVDMLFIRTGYEQWRAEEKYHNDNPGLAPELADELRASFPLLRAVGFDFISLTSWKYREEGRVSHRAFLCGERPLLVIEDVALAKMRERAEWAVVAPLRTVDGNGGPVTIVASVED